MGFVIAVSPWLHDLSLRGAPYTHPAREIMRTQILIRRRRGHVLQLDTEYIRRCIAYSAKYGRVARVIVPCVQCGNQAWLSDWVKLKDLSDGQIRALLEDNRDEKHRLLVAFMRLCPGNEIAQLMERSLLAPREEG